MKDILIFAGTTEGRKLAEYLGESEVSHTVCVATEYGEIMLQEQPFRTIRRGRMDAEEIQLFMEQGAFRAVVDATHPYARIITENVRKAAEQVQLPYLRLLRNLETEAEEGEIYYFNSNESCAKKLEDIKGNILLTTGSKELHTFSSKEEIRNRLYVRVLPGTESIALCQKEQIVGKQILALQGPFSVELNLALIRQYDIRCLVTKKSGSSGGYQEKIQAARQAGIPVYVITKEEESGDSYAEVCRKLEQICGLKLQKRKPWDILLAGIGMGDQETLTKEVETAIQNADILLGAERMVECYQPKLEKRPYYLAKQIIPYLEDQQKKQEFLDRRQVVILFSGDSGFYSGCKKLHEQLCEEIKAGRLQATVRILPGISSLSYLASCIGEDYQCAEIHSMHGKELVNLGKKIRYAKKTFLLMSGVKDVQRLGRILLKEGLADCKVKVGYQLSYKEEQILELSPQQCTEQMKDGLYTCFVYNPNARSRPAVHGKPDEAFIRERVPMTKEEVREVSICKLHLRRDSVVYDIGSGTGSIAVEIAALSDEIKVYALEQKAEAVSLIQKNKEKFGAENLTVVEAKAPEKLAELPVASHAFIGGSGGNLKAILRELYQINPKMRVVMNAVSMETICEMKECLGLYKIQKEEVVQLQVSRARKTGEYHLMRAENPVWICAFQFCE